MYRHIYIYRYTYIHIDIYIYIYSILARHVKLRERKTKKRDQKPRGWMINIKNKIDAIRRKLSHINLIIKCKKENIFTPRQRNIQKKLKRMYGSVRTEILMEMETRLKHDLSVQSKILRDKKAVPERQRINSMFYSNPKNVYREFRKEGNFNVEKHHRNRK